MNTLAYIDEMKGFYTAALVIKDEFGRMIETNTFGPFPSKLSIFKWASEVLSEEDCNNLTIGWAWQPMLS